MVDAGDWNVALNNGTNGADVVEGYIPRAAIGNPTQLTLAFSSTVDNNSDVLKTVDGSANGARIVVDLLQAPDALPVPTLSE